MPGQKLLNETTEYAITAQSVSKTERKVSNKTYILDGVKADKSRICNRKWGFPFKISELCLLPLCGNEMGSHSASPL